MKSVFLVVLLVNILFAYLWSIPKNLGIAGADDINPQACRMQVFNHTCCVWQSNLSGNWDIFSRIGYGPYWGDTAWSDTCRVTIDDASDINPGVVFDDTRCCYWCVWQNDSSGNWDIYVSTSDTSGFWASPQQLTTDEEDDELASVFVIGDTVWVIWQHSDSAAINIFSAHYDGSTWSAPIQVTFDSVDTHNTHPQICRHHSLPFAVWERDGDIHYSHYSNGAWQPSLPITNDLYSDINPEIGVANDYDWGVWVTWQTDRDGNYEIYRTAYDTLDQHYRVTFHDSLDITPSFIRFSAPAFEGRYVGECIAFSTERNGNNDIYTGWLLLGLPDSITPVDTDTADDIRPTMTGSLCYLWALWQTDRNGEWDIYGSYSGVSGIEDSETFDIKARTPLIVCPNPFRQVTDIRYQMTDCR